MSKTLTPNQMLAEIARLTAENSALKTAPKSGSTITFKVSDKGAVSAYGLGRFPVTLYGQQWRRLLARAADIEAFMKANESRLAVKGEVRPSAAPIAPPNSLPGDEAL